MKYIFSFILIAFFFMGCETIEPVDKINSIANNLKKEPKRTFDGCLIRYYIAGYYSRLSESIQKKAIDRAFSNWQKTNQNVLFINTSDATLAEISIRFVNRNQIESESTIADFGIMETTLKPISQLKQIKGLRYEVILDDSYTWNESNICRVISYQVGNYLGFSSSLDPNSVMFSLASSQETKLSKGDSTLFNQLYPLPCKDLSVDYLPLKLKVFEQTTKEIKLEKAGTVIIKSSGIVNAGTFIGDCTPDGKFEFTYLGVTFDISAQYDLVPDMPHCAVIYKINNAPTWTLCKSNCEFKTNGNEYITLTLMLNDSNVSDNKGFFDVNINYK